MSIYAGKVASKKAVPKLTGELGEESEKLSGLLKKTRKPVSIATRTRRLVKKFMPKKRYRKFKVVDVEELAKKQCLKPNIQLFAEEKNTGVVNKNSTSLKNILKNIKYTDKVRSQMKLGDYHSFPESVSGFGSDANITSIVGGDKIIRTKIEIPGSYMGKEGVFQYIIEPDGVTCNHRLFVPNC